MKIKKIMSCILIVLSCMLIFAGCNNENKVFGKMKYEEKETYVINYLNAKYNTSDFTVKDIRISDDTAFNRQNDYVATCVSATITDNQEKLVWISYKGEVKDNFCYITYEEKLQSKVEDIVKTNYKNFNLKVKVRDTAKPNAEWNSSSNLDEFMKSDDCNLEIYLVLDTAYYDNKAEVTSTINNSLDAIKANINYYFNSNYDTINMDSFILENKELFTYTTRGF